MASPEMYLEVIKIIKAKSNRLSAEFTDDEMLMGVKEVEQSIKNYCQIPEVPVQLIYIWANMAIDLLLFQLESNTTPDDVMDAFDPSDVSTIKMGDTSISLGDKYRSNQRSRTLQSHQANLDSLVMNYQSQLNQFRRLL